HLVVTQDGRYFVGTVSSPCGEIILQHRDGSSGLPRGLPVEFDDCDPGSIYQGATIGANGVVATGNVAYAAATGSNLVVGVNLDVGDTDRLSIGTAGFVSVAKDGVAFNGVTPVGLQGVTRLAVTPPTSDGTMNAPQRVSLYALAPGENSLVAF